MSDYWDPRFLKHLNIKDSKVIFEVGARYGDESIKLSKIFKEAKIYSFECNPLVIDIVKRKLEKEKNINYFSFGLGKENEKLPFYSYIKDAAGCSSLFKRIDYEETQKQTGIINIKTLNNFAQEKNINTIDLLCMDVQGYELNVLKGAKDFIKNIKFAILEEPKPIINRKYLPKNTYSKYINAPSSKEIKKFMLENNFTEIERIAENDIEDNVMYKNNLLVKDHFEIPTPFFKKVTQFFKKNN